MGIYHEGTKNTKDTKNSKKVSTVQDAANTVA